MATLKVGFILARRFTLCAFANFVDVLRLSADEGDRSRPILCSWRVLSPTMEAIASSCGVAVQPEERLGDPARFDYLVVVGGLVDEIENLHPDTVGFLKSAAAAGVRGRQVGLAKVIPAGAPVLLSVTLASVPPTKVLPALASTRSSVTNLPSSRFSE